MAQNPFGTDAAARLYAAGRPDYSALVTDIIRRLTGITEPVPCAVDVGSGTGISTIAIAPLAEAVIGVEPSAAMLRYAAPAVNVTYVAGSAENLPMDDSSCDLIAVGSALHWFDRARFLSEASRIATPATWLVVHDHWFSGRMQEQPAFADWVQDTYVRSYPPPPRDRPWRPPADLDTWQHIAWETYDHQVPFTADELVAYLLTQSNLQTVIQRGDRTEYELRTWLKTEVAPFFTDEKPGTFLFDGFVSCHRQ